MRAPKTKKINTEKNNNESKRKETYSTNKTRSPNTKKITTDRNAKEINKEEKNLSNKSHSQDITNIKTEKNTDESKRKGNIKNRWSHKEKKQNKRTNKNKLFISNIVNKIESNKQQLGTTHKRSAKKLQCNRGRRAIYSTLFYYNNVDRALRYI